MVDRIGHVAVGDWVATSPSRRAPIYRVTGITNRHITLTGQDWQAAKSVPVQRYNDLVSVGWWDPRLPADEPEDD